MTLKVISTGQITITDYSDGVTHYNWLKYADSYDGAIGMSDNPDGKRFFGISMNQLSQESSTDPSLYAWSPLYDNVSVGGRNLIINSDTSFESNSHLIHMYTMSEDFIHDETYTISLKGSINIGQTFGVYQNNGDTYKGSMIYNEKKGIHTLTFNASATTSGNERVIGIYNTEEPTATSAVVVWVQIEKGTINTDYTNAPEDIIDVIMSVSGRVASAESAITKDAITNTVMGTTTFNARLAEYATEESLTGYATTEALGGVSVVANSAKTAIDGLDLTPYVKSTQMTQLEDSLTAKISQSGGVNLLRNSIGWNGVALWTPTSGAYLVQTVQSPELEHMGFGAGWYSPIGTYTHHRQELKLPMLGTYTISFYMKKSAYNAGYTYKHAGVDVVVDGETYLVGLNGTTESAELTDGFELFKHTFTATSSKNIVIRLSVTDSSETTISGLMLNLGSESLQWSSHSTEVYNVNVRMDLNGLQVMGNASGKRTVITTEEFAGYENNEKVFWVSGRTTKVKELEAEERFTMAPISIVTIDNGVYSGWAFI